MVGWLAKDSLDYLLNDDINHIHLSACWSSLGQLARQQPAERCWLQRNAEAQEPLVQHTVQAAGSGEIGVRELANIVHGAACNRREKWMDAFFTVLARVAEVEAREACLGIDGGGWAPLCPRLCRSHVHKGRARSACPGGRLWLMNPVRKLGVNYPQLAYNW